MNVIHKIGVILFLLCPYISLYGQEGRDTLTFRIVSYNVENLFDSRHDTLKNDYEFLPDATRHWNYSKYRKKLDNIARVIIATGGWTPPALVALCEVENDSVMRDLTRYSALREADYRYVMTQSPDERGIDVALLYQRNLFKLLSYQSLPVDKPRKNSRPTRDILHVSGLLLNRDTLDVLVAHFPSRSGGARESEPYRLLAARKVKHAIDSLYTIRQHPQIVLLGDFNDYPENKFGKGGVGGSSTVNIARLSTSTKTLPSTSRKSQNTQALRQLQVSRRMGITRPHHRIRYVAARTRTAIYRGSEDRRILPALPTDKRQEIRRAATLPHLLRDEVSRRIQRPLACICGVPVDILVGILIQFQVKLLYHH